MRVCVCVGVRARSEKTGRKSERERGRKTSASSYLTSFFMVPFGIFVFLTRSDPNQMCLERIQIIGAACGTSLNEVVRRL